MAERQFSHDGISLALEDVGSGPPILLIHGFPLDHGMWDAQIESLRGRFRVIAPDLRGLGRSRLAAGDEELGVGMERYAADLAAMLDWLSIGEPIVAVGFSMGGYVALQLALRWPKRLRGLVLCDTRAAADAEEARAARIKMAEAVMQSGSAAPALAMLPKLLAQRTQDERPDIAERVRGIIERQRPEGIAAAQRGMARREDVRGRLDHIIAHSLCIVGREDAISPPAEMHEMAVLLAKSGDDDVRLVEVENAGHLAPIENPAAVTDAIRTFAQECYRPA
ncbi:MAG: alpha/beta hydrolase [Planctomycetota bacterium]|nr:MAG: alpha/beta hydrolase [Planctomycetota bacterium]